MIPTTQACREVARMPVSAVSRAKVEKKKQELSLQGESPINSLFPDSHESCQDFLWDNSHLCDLRRELMYVAEEEGKKLIAQQSYSLSCERPEMGVRRNWTETKQ